MVQQTVTPTKLLPAPQGKTITPERALPFPNIFRRAFSYFNVFSVGPLITNLK